MKEKIGGLREMKRKMVVWFMTAAAALVCMTGCSAEKQEKTPGQQMRKAQEDTRESITLNVFAAASMTETLEMSFGYRLGCLSFMQKLKQKQCSWYCFSNHHVICLSNYFLVS